MNHFSLPDTPLYSTLRELARHAHLDDLPAINGLQFKLTETDVAALSRAIEAYGQWQVGESVRKVCEAKQRLREGKENA